MVLREVRIPIGRYCSTFSILLQIRRSYDIYGRYIPSLSHIKVFFSTVLNWNFNILSMYNLSSSPNFHKCFKIIISLYCMTFSQYFANFLLFQESAVAVVYQRSIPPNEDAFLLSPVDSYSKPTLLIESIFVPDSNVVCMK